MLMGLLFVGGLMNLLWIAGLALLVLIEKLFPLGPRVAQLTGVALIGWGAYEQREIHIGILAEAGRLAAREQLQPPSIIVIGEVVKLRERLQWFASEWFAAVGD